MRERPDPDALLRQVEAEEARDKHGKLKVFLGASAGVGKTYAMLSQAHEQMARGLNVVAGVVETHGRAETEALVANLETLPPKKSEYRGVTLEEFDLDGALRRKPDLLLVDELAHTNVPGSRHPKRWQDVEELLRAGINVYTAVNIQHLESLNDVVAQVTGIPVRETVPDAVMDRADEIELIDIPPDELRQRLTEGKVYIAEQVERALDGFFKKGNLIALRELALRRVADRVDAEMQTYRSQQSISSVWAARERVLVCIAPNNLAAKVVRTTHRLGSAAHAEMLAIFVESDRQTHVEDDKRQLALDALSLATNLGMETLTASGHDIAGEILRIARSRNTTLIVVGKPIKARWREILFGSVVDELVRRSGDINVQVVTGEGESGTIPPRAAHVPWTRSSGSWYPTVIAPFLASAICWPIFGHVAEANLIMVFLLGVTVVAARSGPIQSLASTVLSIACFDFFFVRPFYTFAVSDIQYVPTFATMFAVGLLVSSMTLRIRAQAASASSRERRAAALYDLSKELSRSRSKSEIAVAAARKIRDEFDADAAVLLPSDSGRLSPVAKSRSHFETERKEWPVAQWAFEHGEEAGRGTDTLPNSQGLYLPLKGSRGTVGVLAFRQPEDAPPMGPSQANLIRTFANSVALAIERTVFAKESQTARLQVESERMRNSLLGSVSHDLRTPLTAISGAASLLINDGNLDGEKRHDLAQTIFDEADRLNRHIRDLLDMTKLDSGVEPNLEWQSLEELIGSAVSRTKLLLVGRLVQVEVDPQIPLLRLDGVLIEKVLVNLLENASNHTVNGTEIEVRAWEEGGMAIVEVADHGPGIPVEEQNRIFNKFYRPAGSAGDTGYGMGLAICQTIVQLHRGSISVTNRPEGGAVFRIELPLSGTPPEVPVG